MTMPKPTITRNMVSESSQTWAGMRERLAAPISYGAL